jgi:hypothetical protein
MCLLATGKESYTTAHGQQKTKSSHNQSVTQRNYVVNFLCINCAKIFRLATTYIVFFIRRRLWALSYLILYHLFHKQSFTKERFRGGKLSFLIEFLQQNLQPVIYIVCESSIVAIMDKALEQSLAAKPFIKGMLCADMNGLLITGINYIRYFIYSNNSTTMLFKSSLCEVQNQT